MLESYPIYINGQWLETGNKLEVADKFSGEIFAAVSVSAEAEVDAAVSAALAAFRKPPLPPYRRYEILAKAAALLAERVDELALTITREAGKVLKDAQTEVLRAAQVLQIAAEEAKRITGEMIPVEAAPGAENRLAYTIRVPIGVVLCHQSLQFSFKFGLS